MIYVVLRYRRGKTKKTNKSGKYISQFGILLSTLNYVCLQFQ